MRFLSLLRLSASLLLLPVLGCGVGDDHVPLFPATGLVLVDGQPADGVQLRFYPADSVNNPDSLKPTGVTGADGVYVLGTYVKGDGAPAGRYKVTLYLPTEPPNGSNAPDDQLGGRYLQPGQSPLEATIGTTPTKIEPFRVEMKSRSAPRRATPTKPNFDGVG